MQSVSFEIIYHYKWHDNSTSDVDKTYNIWGDKCIEIEKVSDTFHDYFPLLFSIRFLRIIHYFFFKGVTYDVHKKS